MTRDDLPTNLSEWRPTGPGPHSTVVPLDRPAGALALVADTAESLGVRLTELRWSSASDAGLTSAADLTAAAVAAAKSVTGLLEVLAVYEVDAGRGEAVLRSQTPAVRGDDRSYYELRLHARGNADLRRYTASRLGGGRKPVAFALTHDAIAKLVGDLADALAPAAG